MDEFSNIEDVSCPTIYDKLGSLCTEIEDQIKEVGGATTEIQNSLLSMRNDSYKENSPEAEYAVRLFRKYVAEVSAAKLRGGTSPTNDFDDGDSISLLGDIPQYIYSGTGEQIVGWSALSVNVFWSRLATGLFSFLAFVIMSCVPHIKYKTVDVDMLLLNNCPYRDEPEYSHGSFSFVSFQYVIGLSVVAFVHCLVFAGYYVLPADGSSRKYIPGLRYALELCVSTTDAIRLNIRFADAAKAYSKSVEPVIDGGLFVMCAMASTLAAIAVERGEPIGASDAEIETVYSLNTFVATFENTSPVCVEDGIVRKIRAAIAMSFLATVCLGFTFQVSLRSFFMEKRRRQLQTGEKGQPVPSKSPVDDEETVRL